MNKVYGVFILALIMVFSSGCANNTESIVSVDNAVSSPILYKSDESADGVAVDFVCNLIAGDYKAAFNLLNTENQSWLKSSNELKKYWSDLIESKTVTVTNPGIFYGTGDGEAGADLYCFPASTEKNRLLIIVEILDDKVSLLGTMPNFELAEHLAASLIDASYEEIGILGKPDAVKENWESEINEAGQYQYSDPPYTKLTFDTETFYFPMQFDKQKLIIEITIAYQNEGKVAVLTVNPD